MRGIFSAMVARFTSWKRRPSAGVLVALVFAGGIASTPVWAEDANDTSGTAGGGAQNTAGTASVLPPVLVQGSTYQTESLNGYKTDLISVGEKEARIEREVPQTTTVLTRDYLDDIGATSLDTALRDAPGIVVMSNDNGRSSLLSRGFEFDSLSLNGLPAPLSSIYGTQPDMAIVDHVEILSGPSGLFAGAGEPSGTINMRLKAPARTAQGSAQLSGDSWGGVRAEGDASTPLNADGSVRARFVAAGQKGKTRVDNNDNNVRVGYGVVQADLTERTAATATFSYMKRDIEPFNGLPTTATGKLLDVPRSVTTGADWNDFSNTVIDYIGELEHRFDGGGHAKLSARYSDRDVDFLYAYSSSAAAPNGAVSGMRWLARDYDETSLALDSHVSKPVRLFGQEHNILVGADYQKIDSTMYSGTGVLPKSANNLYAWKTNFARPSVAYNQQTDNSIDKYGLYSQIRIKPVSPLTLIAGARSSWYEADIDDVKNGVRSSKKVDHDAEITPYGGLILDINRNLSAYASYTEIFQPQTELDASGKVIDPREGHQVEIGLKGDFLDDAVSGSAALFKLNDKNRAYQDPVTTKYEATGEVEARGIELQGKGSIRPGWDLFAGYTFTVTEQLTGSDKGSTFSAATPKHMAHLWTKYRLQSGGLWDRVVVGGGVRAFSDFYAISSGTRISAPGYAVFDLMASYDINEKVTATLNINNLFDKKYYERVGGTTVFNFYGEPLSAVMRLKATF